MWDGARGVRLAGDSWGNSRDPLVVLQHGGGQTRHAWKDTGQQLGASGYYAVSFDARGHGDSTWAPDGDYTEDAMVEDLLCVVSAVGGSTPALIGASLGGITSMIAAGEKQLDVRALVIVDVAPRIEAHGVERIHRFMTGRPEGFTSLDEVADAISAYQPHRPRPSSLDGLAKNLRVGADGRYRWHWDPRFRPDQRDPLAREPRLSRCVQALTVPTLLVRGAKSDVLSAASVEHFMTLCPHAQTIDVAGAAHMVAGDRNDLFGDAMRGFLDRALGRE
ncbi:alpha/beta hydrolase [Paraburkholderia sp. BCC1886]|uniref:alpha/beta fold hydrolase n=1 Tax=Paraburkholderia sp. BCC1886 TaxID=2562670 RepID=UPI0028CB24F5|nr:alpha/beta hydrolase [Paraburkholderia sp. BCC1886]